MNQPEIFIHVGMSRTASTFLQHKVFPQLKGIFYERKIKFRQSYNTLEKAEHARYLISDELDNRDIEQVLTGFSERFPHSKSIIILRRQDEWIVSQYKRHLKNGDHRLFKEFFDLEDDNGYIKKKHLLFYNFIDFLDKHFKYKPLVISYDDLKLDPAQVLLEMAGYMGAEINLPDVNFAPKHVSYNDRQLRAIYRASGILNLSRSKRSDKKWKNRLAMLIPDMIRYVVLYGSLIIPELSKSKDRVLPGKEQIGEIRQYFREDWEKCINRTKPLKK